MSFAFEHGGVTSYCGDNRTIMAQMEPQSVQCCVTSPPYFGLRDYGTATWEGGDSDCAHAITRDDGDNKAVFGGRVNRGERAHCLKCGAARIDSQIGLEPTPDEYVAALVEVFRGVWRVLKNDGTLWLNLGDSYCSQGGPQVPQTANANRIGGSDTQNAGKSRSSFDGLKPKDLIGIPWRVAFALQADGWYLRSDIIWSKPNPMPESVTDRPTKAHEYLFLLTKNAKYFYDADAIREPLSAATMEREQYGRPRNGHKAFSQGIYHSNEGMPSHFASQDSNPNGRNKRSVWEVATQPCSEAHFATFPPKLIEPCILAGSKQGDAIIDPFGGSGTTAMVARNLGRRAVLCELNPEYIEIQKRRLDTNQNLLFSVAGEVAA